MRILSYIIELLVLAFMITAVIFMAKQPKIDEVQVKQEADSSSLNKLDNLNLLLEEDSTSTDTTAKK